jgi:hypothetical protein
MDLINTPLQRGVGKRNKANNRFNGLCCLKETVETVPWPSTPRFTPLKRGVNETSRTFQIREYLTTGIPGELA